MAKKTSLYARALVQSLRDVSEKEQRARVARFKSLLKKRGDLRLLSGVLGEFAKLWEQRNGKIANIVSAKKASPAFLETAGRALKKEGYVAKEEVNELLIGGSAVFLGNEYLIDSSVRGKLHKLRLFLKA
ncbi:MAG: F0F1 ATP synthase subunit delta [bacterium]|nr:F0F1 ATP synthase subunit delta [bacterium]